MNVYSVEVPEHGKSLYLVNAETPEEAVEKCKNLVALDRRVKVQWEDAVATLQEGRSPPKIKLTMDPRKRKTYKKKIKAEDVDWEYWAKVYYSGVSARKIAKQINGSDVFVLTHVKKFADQYPQGKRKGKKNEI
jgi:hypothetical protein